MSWWQWFPRIPLDQLGLALNQGCSGTFKSHLLSSSSLIESNKLDILYKFQCVSLIVMVTSLKTDLFDATKLKWMILDSYNLFTSKELCFTHCALWWLSISKNTQWQCAIQMHLPMAYQDLRPKFWKFNASDTYKWFASFRSYTEWKWIKTSSHKRFWCRKSLKSFCL